MSTFLAPLAYLWPTSSSRLAKLYRGLVIAIAGAVLTYLSAWLAGQDFGPWTPLVSALWAVAVNTLRQGVEWLQAHDGLPGVE